MKPVIRSFAKERLGNLSKRAKETYDELCAKQEKCMRYPTEQNMVEERRVAEKWENIS